MTINKRTTSSCAFESGDSIDLPGDYNKYDDIYGSTDTTNHGLYTTINIVSERYKGYTISVDGKQIGVEGQGGDVLDGRYTFKVAGNQQHLIRIDHPMNWAWWQYIYNAGDNITYDFDNAGNININKAVPNEAQPSSGEVYTPTGSYTTINIISNQYRGYTVSVDGKQIGVEGQGGDVLDGRYTFKVAGNQQHLIRIDHPMNWKWWQYFYNAGDNITYDF
jgi:hypothetical protein